MLDIVLIPAIDLTVAIEVILLEAADTILMYRILRTLPIRPALGTAVIVLIATIAITLPIAMRRLRSAPLIPSRLPQLPMLLT